MNLGITITSTVLVLLVVAPVVLMQQQQKNKERKLLKALKSLASQHHSSITEYDIFKNFAIGLDNQNNYLFFYKSHSTNETFQRINLNNIKSCGVSSSRKPNHKNSSGDIVHIKLVFNSTVNSSDNQSIEIYNQTEDFQLNGELEIVRKWEHKIREILK